MSNHPNRSNPITPDMVIALRNSAELTQTTAAKLWRCSLRTVQRWESQNEIRPSYAAWVGMQEIIRREK